MRQPEVARPLLLVLALVLVAPVGTVGWGMLLAGAFLIDFFGDGAPGALAAMTAPPARRPMAIDGSAADRWIPAGSRPRPLVLVHGFAPEGKDDARVRRAAELLARLGFDVVVPTIPGLTAGRLRAADVGPVLAALATHEAPSVLVAVSVGSGPALLAAADPRVRDRVSTVLSLGGYASGRELVRFFLTGRYAYGGVSGQVSHDPALVRAFVDANRDLLETPPDPAGLRESGPGRDPLDRLPPNVTALLDALSPLRVARDIRARLILVHGRDDRAIPYTEALRLAAARPEGTSVVLVRLVSHIEGQPVRWLEATRDVAALWSVLYRLRAAG